MLTQRDPRPTGSELRTGAARRKPRVRRAEEGREVPEWEIKLGKAIFYLTVALSLWFFYWFAGIQCPC